MNYNLVIKRVVDFGASTSSQVLIGLLVYNIEVVLTTHERLLEEDVVDSEQQLRRAYRKRDFFCRCHINHPLSREEADNRPRENYFTTNINKQQEKNFNSRYYRRNFF